MAQAKGSNAKVIYDVETTFGSTPGSPDAKVLPIISEGLLQKRALNRTQVIRGNRNPTKPTRGNKDVVGPFNTELNPFMGIILKHLFGQVSTTGTGPYVHTGKIGALPVSLCIEKGFSDVAQYFLYNGCRIDKGSFEFNPSGMVPFSFDVLGKKETVSGSSFDATPVDYGHLPWDTAEMAIKEGGSTIAVVTQVKLDIGNSLDGNLYVIGGGGERRAILEGTAAVAGVLTALFEDMTLLNKAKNGTESSLQLTLSRGDGLGGAGNELLDFLYPELIYEETSPAIRGPQGIVVDLAFEGYYDNSSEATAAQFVLKNTQAVL